MGKKTGGDADRASIVRKLIRKFGEQEQNEAKISVGDFLRLLGAMKELEEEEGVEEIRVKWVEKETAEL